MMNNPPLERLLCKTIGIILGGLGGGLFIPHEHPECKANKLSWCDDVGFILNGRRVIVSWLDLLLRAMCLVFV